VNLGLKTATVTIKISRKIIPENKKGLKSLRFIFIGQIFASKRIIKE